MKVYLASKSPRRRALLTQMGIDFELLLVDTPEQVVPGEAADAYSLRVTDEKLTAAWQRVISEQLSPMPVLCADTEVVLDGEILGKPRDYQDAFQTLKRLSGRSHRVITSVGVKYGSSQNMALDETLVTFAAIPDEAIHHYLVLDDYQDKAGSYGIQSYIGQYISRVEGCFYSVMGLPLNTVRELLSDFSEKLKASIC